MGKDWWLLIEYIIQILLYYKPYKQIFIDKNSSYFVISVNFKQIIVIIYKKNTEIKTFNKLINLKKFNIYKTYVILKKHYIWL